MTELFNYIGKFFLVPKDNHAMLTERVALVFSKKLHTKIVLCSIINVSLDLPDQHKFSKNWNLSSKLPSHLSAADNNRYAMLKCNNICISWKHCFTYCDYAFFFIFPKNYLISLWQNWPPSKIKNFWSSTIDFFFNFRPPPDLGRVSACHKQ